MSDGRSWTRRRFLIGAGGLAAGGVAAVVAVGSSNGDPATVPYVPLGDQPHGLPARQHAWDATLARDSQANPVAPRHDLLIFFDVKGTPGANQVRLLEATLRSLERGYHWSPEGLLFTASWGNHYFQHVLGVASPIPRARALSDFELPAIDDYDLCLHLACDDEQRLQTIEHELIAKLAPALGWRETRTGFVGAGLPAAHQRVSGIPAGDPVPKTSPLFMGFRSSLKKNQATEDSVTIAEGPFALGTTMQVSYMRLRLDSWYDELSYRERVARMYSPQTTPAEIPRITTDAKSEPALLNQAITRYGVIGHSQTSARARRNGRPLIIRRDFNTVDGGQAGVHFVSLQRTIGDFITTRTAMNATTAQLRNPAITDTVNNGINDFIFVLKRANYIVPSRADRSFPLAPGRDSALG